LNDQTIQLFFDARNNTSLKLFDCARLTEAGLESIAFFNPRLQELLMKECGRLNDAIVERFAFNLTNLRSVTLCGAYLITDSAFAGLVKALAEQLVSLHVENSPKLAGQTLLELGSSRCRRLERLSLRNCTALSDQHVIDSGIFGGNCRLTELDFAHSVALTEQAFSAGLPGQTLRRFCLDGCHRIGDSLFDQIASHCPNLEDLSIEGVVVRPSEERSKAIGNLLSALPRLRRLNCGQNLAMDCTQLARVCSEKLTALCLNGMRQLVDLGQLKALINRLSDDADCVDLSWIPAMNDDCLELVMQRCADGCKLYVYGCTGLTDIAFDYWRKHRPTVSCFGSPFL
jgi:DNA repair protein RAD7